MLPLNHPCTNGVATKSLHRPGLCQHACHKVLRFGVHLGPMEQGTDRQAEEGFHSAAEDRIDAKHCVEWRGQRKRERSRDSKHIPRVLGAHDTKESKCLLDGTEPRRFGRK